MYAIRFQVEDYHLTFIHVIFPYELHYRNTFPTTFASVLGPFNVILNSQVKSNLYV